jgi:hypothetical protein
MAMKWYVVIVFDEHRDLEFIEITSSQEIWLSLPYYAEIASSCIEDWLTYPQEGERWFQ